MRTLRFMLRIYAQSLPHAVALVGIFFGVGNCVFGWANFVQTWPTQLRWTTGLVVVFTLMNLRLWGDGSGGGGGYDDDSSSESNRINPATGLPMCGGGSIDVGGDVYGSNYNAAHQYHSSDD